MKNSKQTNSESHSLIQSLLTTQSRITLEDQLNIDSLVSDSLVKCDFVPSQQLGESLVNEANSKITILNKQMTKLRHVHFNPCTQEPGSTNRTMLENILSEYRAQFKNKPTETQALSIKEIINIAINTGISFGNYIKIIHKNKVLFVPSKIGSASIGGFIHAIEKIHDEESLLLQKKATEEFANTQKSVETQALSDEDEDEQTRLINTRRYWLPLHKYKSFFPSAIEPQTTSDNQTGVDNLLTKN